MHALKDRQRPTEIAQYVGRDWARKPRRILPEIRSGRDWTRGPRRIPPGGLPARASRLPSSAVGASFPFLWAVATVPALPLRPCKLSQVIIPLTPLLGVRLSR